MNLSTAINHKNRATTQIIDLWHYAKTGKMSHSEILDKKETITKSIAHCPVWVKSYVIGRYDALYDQCFHQELEFCHIVKKVLYTTSKLDTGKPKTERLYKKGLGGYLSKNNNSAFFWRGTDKQF